MPFSFEESQIDDCTKVLSLQGTLKKGEPNAEYLPEAVEMAMMTHPVVLLDVLGVTSANGSGVGLLLQAVGKGPKADATLALCGPTGRLLDILNRSKNTHPIPVFGSKNEALEQIGLVDLRNSPSVIGQKLAIAARRTFNVHRQMGTT